MNIIINTLPLGSPIIVTYHIHRKTQQRALQEKHDSLPKNWQQLTEVSQQCQWKMEVRSNSIRQGGKRFFFLLLPSFSMATIFKPAQLPIYWFPSVFWDSIYILHFLRWSVSLLSMQSQAFMSAPNGYILLLLTAPSATPLCPFAQHEHVRTDFWSQQTCQMQAEQSSLPFLHLITLFSLRKSFHTDLCPSYSLLAQFTQGLFMAHSESPQKHTWKCNSTKLLGKSLYPPSCCPLTHFCRAPTKTQWSSRWDPTAFWADWAYSIHLHTLGRVHLLSGGSAAFQRGQDKHSSALKSSCKAPRWGQRNQDLLEVHSSLQKELYHHSSYHRGSSPFFLSLQDAWDARHWYWRTQNY